VGVLIEAVLIVLAVSFIALGLHFKPNSWKFTIDWRPGLVVGITIPLVLAITFVAMYYWKVGLHKISLGSLIIALGLLVDDAIIAVEMMVRKLEEGFDKVRAATFAYEATAMPMLTGTLITAVGFLPIGLAQSTVGGLFCALPGDTVAQSPCSCAWRLKRCSRIVRLPFLHTLSQRGELVCAAPLDHHRFDGAQPGAGCGWHGQSAAAVFSRLQPLGSAGGFVVAGRHLVCGQ
jgi:AcrB/AcrD/AcrF family